MRYKKTNNRVSLFIKLIVSTIILQTIILGCSLLQPEEAEYSIQDSVKEQPELLVYVAAGIREAVEDAALEYNKNIANYPINFKFVFNNSGRLLTQLELHNEGDIFISSELQFMEKAIIAGLADNKFDLATFVPAIVVAAGNPLGIKTLADLTKPGVRVAICENSAAMGKAAEKILSEQGILDEVTPNIINRPATAPQIALNVALNQADVGITGRNSGGEIEDKLDFIMIPPEINSPTLITAAVLNSSGNISNAELFVDFLCSPAVQAIFKKHNFGDVILK